MLFNSFNFLIFLPLVLVLYHVLAHKYRWMLLLAASYYFYGSWNEWYLGLILLSTLVDYKAALSIHKAKKQKTKKNWLWASILTNLGILFTFKYFNFFADSLQQILDNAGVEVPALYLDVLLPVGISFYTFQTISYTIDVYKGRIEPEQHLGYFALYVSFFPQLVAGPIERAGNLLPQFRKKTEVSVSDIHSAINRILYGFVKKVVIADRLAFYVNNVFGDLGEASTITILLASFFFLIQVYCDFSGYSDIAIGVAQLLGIKLMINFSRPFLSTSFTEYWQRWHISLSNWVRDYIYIPLGGNRVSTPRLYANILLSFMIMGLWHGASWSFVIWGLMHGALLVIERLVKTPLSNLLSAKLQSVLGWGLVMFSFTISMIFFRADSTSDAFLALSQLVSFDSSISLSQIMAGINPNDFYLCFALIGLLALSYLLPQKFNFRYNYIFATISLSLILLLGVNETFQFVYFQF